MQEQSSQLTENMNKISVVKRAKSARRLSAAHLSDEVRRRIVALMEFHESAEAAAAEACREFPGIKVSARLVFEVMVLSIRRKPPTQEIALSVGMRRSA